MPPTATYDEPFHWWGPGWNSPPRRSLGDLLRDGTLDTETGALLWAALVHRRSLVIVGGPSGLGKSTILCALVDLLPATTRPLFLRGCFETFAFLGDPLAAPDTSALVINEISPHLPIYLWGPAVSRVLDAAQFGYPLLATAHGASVIEFVASLTGSPLRIPAARLAAFEFVALLEPSHLASSGRQIGDIWRLSKTRHGLDVTPMLARECGDHNSMKPEPPNCLPAPFSARELAERGELLAKLRDGQIDTFPTGESPDPRAGARSRPGS